MVWVVPAHMPKGPLGGPRPKAEYKIILDPQEAEVHIQKVGPLGFPRPFAKNNPPITDENVAECMLSSTGQKFGAGYVSGGETKQMAELPPEAQQEALEVTEKYCEGTLEGMAINNIEEGSAIPALSRVRAAISRATGRADSISIDMTEVSEEEIDEFEDV